ncbi:MAG TPA: bifunctional DNA-formamidopyrimidine glycosylase/DNA-(apurinic or apyrimidinic site) lyase [Verrucomicrobiae bacterium]|jgi:formamidopyrimidine-DNA glycosylase
MPELPEVEVLGRRLWPLLRGKTIRGVTIHRARAVRPNSPEQFRKALAGAKFISLTRRAKYLLFGLKSKSPRKAMTILGHLGMTGRMYLALKSEKLPKHAAIVFDLGDRNFIYEDFRYFGRMTLDLSPLENLGPEPLDKKFSPQILAAKLKGSRQAIKIKLLDQSLIAGVGNIYASESLYRARISPKLAANRLTLAQTTRLCRTIREVLNEAIRYGSTVPLKSMSGKSDALFYFSDGSEGFCEKRLRVYNRAGQPCLNCRTPIQRLIQAARSTFYCPDCQKR